MAGLESTLCLCDASDGACCNMLNVAHCTPTTPHPTPHPPPSYFWTPSIVRWLPPQHLCLVSATNSMEELEGTHESQHEPQPKPAYCSGSNNKKKSTCCFTVSPCGLLRSRATDFLYSDINANSISAKGPWDFAVRYGRPLILNIFQPHTETDGPEPSHHMTHPITQ